MPTRILVGRWRGGLKGLAIAAIGLLTAVVVVRQESRPVTLPNGPAKAGFDIARFSNAGNGWFETFHVTKTEPLGDVLKAKRVAEDTRLLVTETKAGRLCAPDGPDGVPPPRPRSGRRQGLDGHVLTGL